MKRFFAVLLCLLVAVPACAFWPFSSPDAPYVTQENTQERVLEEIVRKDWSITADWSDNPGRVEKIELYKQVQGGVAVHLTVRIDDKYSRLNTLNAFADGVSSVLVSALKAPELISITEFRFFGEAEGKGFNVVKMNISRENAERVTKGMEMSELQPLAIPGSFWTALR